MGRAIGTPRGRAYRIAGFVLDFRSAIVSLTLCLVIRRPARRLTRVAVAIGVVRPEYVIPESNMTVGSSVLPFVVNSPERTNG